MFECIVNYWLERERTLTKSKNRTTPIYIGKCTHVFFRVCALDPKDVTHIYEEMWHGKSVVSGPSDKLTLTRWDRSKPASLLNTVCLTRLEANTHDKLPDDANLEDFYGKEIYHKVVSRIEQEKEIQKIWNNVL